MHDLQHVFQGQRLKKEAIGGVVIGGHRFRVAVDHDGLVAVFAQRQGRVHTAIVELDALADTVGAAAEHDDLIPLARLRLAFLFIGGIHIGGGGREFRGAGVHPLIHRAHTQLLTLLPHRPFGGIQQGSQPAIGKSLLLDKIKTILIK